MLETPAGSEKRPLRVAIFGSGPSGFYAADELLKQTSVKIEVDMFDRLPTPFGLVRGGVAPDHPKIKSVVKVYERTAAKPGFRFFGNVEFGRDISIDDVRSHYDAAIFAIGAKSDRKMDIPGEDLEGSHAATELVGWYNGHPDYRNFQADLSCERAVVIGIGNVAIDVTRILARDPATLKDTDIAQYALEALQKSRLKEVYMIGRRGPVQAAFTNPEIRELMELPGSDLIVDPKEAELDELSRAALEAGEGGTKAKNNVKLLTEQSKRPTENKPKKIYLKLLMSPVKVIGRNGRVSAIKLEKNVLYKSKDGSLRPKGTGQFETIEVGLVFRSVGYKGVPLPGLPYNEKKGIIPNEDGRVKDPQAGKNIPGLYVVGWAKRGPSGVIGTNKPDSSETVKLLLEDFQTQKTSKQAGKANGSVIDLLKKRNVEYVTFKDWKKLDELEIQRGKPGSKSREKFSNVPNMLAALRKLKEKNKT